MKCLRCGHCCIQCFVVVVVQDRAVAKPGGVRCPNLSFDPRGRAVCGVHREPWYRLTPCYAHGNPKIDPDYAVNPGKPCAFGLVWRGRGQEIEHVEVAGALEDLRSRHKILGKP